MMIKKNRSYVLIFSLTIMSLVTIMTYQLLRMAYVGFHFDRAMIDRERAEMLAFGGVNLAMAQLLVKEPAKGKEPRTDEEKKKYGVGGFLRRVLPYMNRWQVFNLDKEIDGIGGQIKICISCEDGKINLNEAFDFSKKEFKPEYKALLESLQFKGKEKSKGEIYKKLVEFFKKRKKKLDDLSELHSRAIPQLRTMFYEPPFIPERKREAKPNDDLAVQDIFTIWGRSDKIEALFLSDAVSAIFGLRRPHAYDHEVKKERFKKVIEKFKKEQDENTQEYWESVKPLYEQKVDFKVWERKIFSSKFEPKVYSVLSSGKVGDVEQRLLAIIEKKAQEQSEDSKDEKEKKEQQVKTAREKEEEKKKKQVPKPFKILRIYWI